MTGSDVVGRAVVVAVCVGDMSREAFRLTGSTFLVFFDCSRLFSVADEFDCSDDDELEFLEEKRYDRGASIMGRVVDRVPGGLKNFGKPKASLYYLMRTRSTE